MAVHKPTVTFKGGYDGVGNLYKESKRRAELAEIGRHPTIKSYMSLLWSQHEKTSRKADEIYTYRIQHQLYVM